VTHKPYEILLIRAHKEPGERRRALTPSLIFVRVQSLMRSN
jgi:hypothetical protein